MIKHCYFRVDKYFHNRVRCISMHLGAINWNYRRNNTGMLRLPLAVIENVYLLWHQGLLGVSRTFLIYSSKSWQIFKIKKKSSRYWVWRNSVKKHAECPEFKAVRNLNHNDIIFGFKNNAKYEIGTYNAQQRIISITNN